MKKHAAFNLISMIKDAINDEFFFEDLNLNHQLTSELDFHRSLIDLRKECGGVGRRFFGECLNDDVVVLL